MFAIVISLFILNWYFVPPVHELSVASSSDVVTLAVFYLGRVSDLDGNRERGGRTIHEASPRG